MDKAEPANASKARDPSRSTSEAGPSALRLCQCLFFALLASCRLMRAQPLPQPDEEEDPLANKELYSSSRYYMGMVNEWGVFLRDREVAAETSLAVDGFRVIPSSRMQRVLGKSQASQEEQVSMVTCLPPRLPWRRAHALPLTPAHNPPRRSVTQDMAMQMCKMIISGIRREMMEANTLYQGLRGPLPVQPSMCVWLVGGWGAKKRVPATSAPSRPLTHPTIAFSPPLFPAERNPTR